MPTSLLSARAANVSICYHIADLFPMGEGKDGDWRNRIASVINRTNHLSASCP